MTSTSPAGHTTPADTQTPTISLQGITISFRRPGDTRLTIVEDLDLELHPGQLVCIAGRSGSGKTSILRVAAGLNEPESGHVQWQSVPLSDRTPDQIATSRRQLCGIMEQHAALIPDLSALENVLLAAVPDRRTTELRPRAHQLLSDVGLAPRMKHRPASLSGGERQRVALARALLLSPPVIIADEPTASLDRRWADIIIETLQTEAADNVAVLVASHDPNLIERADITIPLD